MMLRAAHLLDCFNGPARDKASLLMIIPVKGFEWDPATRVVKRPQMDGWKGARRCNQGSAVWESKAVDDEQLHLLNEALHWALITLHSAWSEYRRLSPSDDPRMMTESSELMAARRNLYIAMQTVGEIRRRISNRNREMGTYSEHMRADDVVLH
jgi:hypothetical protein